MYWRYLGAFLAGGLLVAAGVLIGVAVEDDPQPMGVVAESPQIAEFTVISKGEVPTERYSYVRYQLLGGIREWRASVFTQGPAYDCFSAVRIGELLPDICR